MLGKLGRRCDGSHDHKQLRGKHLAEAVLYPAELVHSIIRGMNLTYAADMLECVISNDNDPGDPHFLCSASRIRGYGAESKVLGTCQMKRTSGDTMNIVYNALSFKKAYHDEYTGELLPEALVREAIIEELNYLFGGRCLGVG